MLKFCLWLGKERGGKLLRYSRRQNQEPKQRPQADLMGGNVQRSNLTKINIESCTGTKKANFVRTGWESAGLMRWASMMMQRQRNLAQLGATGREDYAETGSGLHSTLYCSHHLKTLVFSCKSGAGLTDEDHDEPWIRGNMWAKRVKPWGRETYRAHAKLSSESSWATMKGWDGIVLIHTRGHKEDHKWKFKGGRCLLKMRENFLVIIDIQSGRGSWVVLRSPGTVPTFKAGEFPMPLATDWF